MIYKAPEGFVCPEGIPDQGSDMIKSDSITPESNTWGPVLLKTSVGSEASPTFSRYCRTGEVSGCGGVWSLRCCTAHLCFRFVWILFIVSCFRLASCGIQIYAFAGRVYVKARSSWSWAVNYFPRIAHAATSVLEENILAPSGQSDATNTAPILLNFIMISINFCHQKSAINNVDWLFSNSIHRILLNLILIELEWS